MSCSLLRTRVFVIESHRQDVQPPSSSLFAEICVYVYGYVCKCVHICIYTCAKEIVHLFPNSTTATVLKNLTNKLFVSVSLCPFASNKASGSTVLLPCSQLNS